MVGDGTCGVEDMGTDGMRDGVAWRGCGVVWYRMI